MTLNVNFDYSKEVSFTREEVELILNIINKLQQKYKDVVINSIGDYDEFDDKNSACYVERDKAIYVNQTVCSGKCGERILLEDFKKQREVRLKRIEKRRKINPDLLKHVIPMDGFGCVIECCVRHEFCHALIHTYRLNKNKEIIDMFNSLSKLEIGIELMSYAATNIDEFICCCFEESFFEDARPLSLRVMEIVDRVVFENESNVADKEVIESKELNVSNETMICRLKINDNTCKVINIINEFRCNKDKELTVKELYKNGECIKYIKLLIDGNMLTFNSDNIIEAAKAISLIEDTIIFERDYGVNLNKDGTRYSTTIIVDK